MAAVSPFRGFHVREKPPLRRYIQVTTPSGRHHRWARDEPRAENVFSGLRHSSVMSGGFETLDVTLRRKPGVDYSDLVPLSTLQVLKPGGGIVSEYRLEGSPRVSGDQVSISPSAVGWQAALDDDKSAHELYVHQDLSAWGEMPANEKIRQLGFSRDLGSFSWSSENGAIVLALPNQLLAAEAFAATWFLGAAGIAISKAMYKGSQAAVPGGYEAAALYSADDDASGGEISTALTLDGTLRTATPATAKRYQHLHLYTSGAAATPAAGANRRLEDLALYGNSGIPTTPIAGEPDGVLLSDVEAHALARWAPLLNFIPGETIQPSSFPIPHLAALEMTTVAEILKQAGRFELRDWAVWENRTYWSNDRGARARNWRGRVGEVQLTETGPRVDRLWESVVVQWNDTDGTTKTVGPPGSGADFETSELKDPDPQNPANQLGSPRRDLLQMGRTSTLAGATEVGRRFLEHSKLLDTSGQAKIVGFIQDDRGVWGSYDDVRAGDTLTVVNAADPSPRRIIRADNTEDDRTCSVDLDAPPDGLEQLLERLGVVLVALGQS